MRFLCLTLFAVPVLAGCGAAATAAPASAAAVPAARSAGPVSEHGRSRYEVTVGSAGGTLELNNGIRLHIPAGALDQEVDLVFYVTTESRVFGQQEDQAAT